MPCSAIVGIRQIRWDGWCCTCAVTATNNASVCRMQLVRRFSSRTSGRMSLVTWRSDGFTFRLMPLRRSRIKRNVNTSDLQVTRDILPEVRELKRRTSCIRQTLALFVAVTAQVQHQPSHRICRIPTIAEHGIPVRIALHGLVLTESYQKIREGLLGNIFRDDRLAQRYEDRV